MSQQQNDIQERIAAARREAEQLKEKIRAKRESSADTSRSYHSQFPFLLTPNLRRFNSSRHGCRGRPTSTNCDAPTKGTQGSFSQNLRNALGE